MAEEGDTLSTPQRPVPFFAEGDMVHVFEGTGVGKVGMRHVGWFGKVVGREGDAYLVRNRLLAAKGRPTLVEAKFIRIQTDFGLECGSGERVHFRNLCKRTRERILESADERNNWIAKEAQQQLLQIKKQKTQEKEAYFMRRQQKDAMGTASMQQSKTEFEQQLHYWQCKCETLQQRLKDNLAKYKRISKKKEVLIFLVLSYPVSPFYLISCYLA
jgi:ribosomal protein L21E